MSLQLYPCFTGSKSVGWIRGRWVEKAGQRRRRYYRLTPAGRKVLASQRDGWPSSWRQSVESPEFSMPDWKAEVKPALPG